jgi:hypothetical protein
LAKVYNGVWWGRREEERGNEGSERSDGLRRRELLDGHGESRAVEVGGGRESSGSTNGDDMIGIGGSFEKGERRPGLLLAGEWRGWIGRVEYG